MYSRLRHLAALLLIFSATALFGAESPSLRIAWIRILNEDGEAVTWHQGESWPAAGDHAAIAPSALLSYTWLKPGDSLDQADLDLRCAEWQRALELSSRFSRVAVNAVELDGRPLDRGVVVEASALDVPLFGGGAAYGSAVVPLVGGRRSSLSAAAGPNIAYLDYRNEILADKPLVFEASLAYANDLVTGGAFSGNRVTGSLAMGPRLGPLCDLSLGCHGGLPLDSVAGSAPFAAIDLNADFAQPFIVGSSSVDLTAWAKTSFYPSTLALRFSALATLDFFPSSFYLSGIFGLGLSSGNLDRRELFDLDQGSIFLLGPEKEGQYVSQLKLGRLFAFDRLFQAPLTSWLRLEGGPFAFGEFASADTGNLGAASGGLRLTLGAPVNLSCDIGYAVTQSALGGVVFSVEAVTLL